LSKASQAARKAYGLGLLRTKRDMLGLWQADGSGPFVPPEPRDVQGCAILFEGGGMRASYTTAAVVTLIEQGIRFPFVCGVSAGSSNVVNYLHGDPWRARESFTDIAADARFGDWKTLLAGKGIFSAHWIYQESCLPGEPLTYNYGRYEQSAGELAIQAFDIDNGESVVWHRNDIHCLEDLMLRVRASSSIPFMMPFTQVDGRTFADGGLGVGAGLALQCALDAGYERVFAVLTRPKGYRKGKTSKSQELLAALYERRHPCLADALRTRNERYDAELERLEQMEREGRAHIVYADGMAVSSSTSDPQALQASYLDAYGRYQKQLPEWLSYLSL
jgi:predicted patatin/cPLA2 family phospholipase